MSGSSLFQTSLSASLRRVRTGFTLIEILVVIAIVSLLVAILLPTMATARQNSRRLGCQSNLRQLAVAWHSYLDQFDGYFLQRPNANHNYGGRQGKGGPNYTGPKPLNTFLNLQEEETGDAKVFFCPADNGGAALKVPAYSYYGTSYGTNQLLVGQNAYSNYNPDDPCASVFDAINLRIGKLRRSQVGGEGRLVLMGDIGWEGAWDRYLSPSSAKSRVEWHNKAYSHNLAFMDGHVEFVRIRKGLHVTEHYGLIPFSDLSSLAAKCQEEVLTP